MKIASVHRSNNSANLSSASRFAKVIVCFVGIVFLSAPGILNGAIARPKSSPQSSAPAASTLIFSIAPAQSKIHFTLNATAHDVHGEFDLKRGEIRLDPSTGSASGEISVDATSGRSGSDGRDSKMHREVLESSKFPEIIFRPDRVDGFSAATGTIHASLHGVFSIHGADHEITIPVEATISGTTWSVTAKFSVPYVAWGLHDPSNFFLHVGHTVEIELTASGNISNSAAPAN